MNNKWMGFPVRFDSWRIFHTKDIHAHTAMIRVALCWFDFICVCWIVLPNAKSPEFVRKHSHVKLVSIQAENDSHIAHETNVFHFDFSFFFSFVRLIRLCRTSVVQAIENQMLRNENHLLENFQLSHRIENREHTLQFEKKCIQYSVGLLLFLELMAIFVRFVRCVINRIQLENCVIVDWWWAFYSENFVLNEWNAGITISTDSLIFRFFIDSILKIASIDNSTTCMNGLCMQIGVYCANMGAPLSLCENRILNCAMTTDTNRFNDNKFNNRVRFEWHTVGNQWSDFIWLSFWHI